MRKGGEQLTWFLAFNMYVGSFPCAQLPGPVHTARFGRVFIVLEGKGEVCALCVHLYFFICLYLPILLCFPEQLSQLSVGASVTNLNEPPRALIAASSIMWVRS